MGNLNLLVVFIEGVFSFFSPCVLPILPVYLSILSSSSIEDLKEGKLSFKNTLLFKNTILFVLGISSTFFILGSSISVLNYFFTSNKQLLTFIGGFLIIFMGIFYMGYINVPFLQREKRFSLEVREMKPVTAYLLGFTFSFGWTPCIGPVLASVLIMASSSGNMFTGNILILLYSIGFTLPFIIMSIFYSKLFIFLDKVKIHMGTIKKVGGVILIVSGIIMVSGGTDKTLSNIKSIITYPIEYIKKDPAESSENSADKINPLKKYKTKAPDFTLVDQYGSGHKLSDYKGKVVFLNFWATWCPPCRNEMPEIEELYKEYKNIDVVILAVAAPNIGTEGSKEDIISFLSKNGYTFPVVFDNTGEVMDKYRIEAFPTTFVINRDGTIDKYVQGAMNKSTMESIINNAK